MIELLKKTVLTGIGLVSMSMDKVEEWAKNFAEESKLAEDEGKKFVQDVLKQSEEARKTMEIQVKDWVTKALDAVDLSTKSTVDEMKKKIDELEKKLKDKG